MLHADHADGPAIYASHGRMTEPGVHAARLDELPDDLEALCAAIRGLILHYASAAGARLAQARREEVRTRRVAAMLARIVELDQRPLGRRRRPEARLVGCCRDFATLLCATLRRRGVPCRVRVGFADYLAAGVLVDHWVAEYWDATGRRWVLVDAEYEPGHGPRFRSTVDPTDLSDERFIGAGRAWRACRTGQADAKWFGYDRSSTGLSVVRANVLHDVACLQKIELTPWDFWGLGLEDVDRLSGSDLALIDRVAEVTAQAGTPRWADESWIAEPALRVPDVVTSVTLSERRVETRI